MFLKTESKWENAKNILCIRLDSLGDVIMTTPAIRALKESLPGRRITLLTSASGAEGADLIPEIDEVIVYEAPWMKSTSPREDSRLEYLMAAQLQQKGFDGAVIFTVFSQNPMPAAFLCYLAGIPLRLAHCRENPYQMLTNWVADQDHERGIRHEVRRQLDLVASIGCRPQNERLSIQVPSGANSRVQGLLINAGLKVSQPWVVVHPGATASSRRYAPESFAAAARGLVQDYGVQVVFTGSQSESGLIQEIQDSLQAQSISLAGRLNLGEFAALLEMAPVLISNNTGPVHIACAVGTPVVDLYALTNPQHTPWKVPSRVLNHDVPCKFCYRSVCPEGHHNCLRLVKPEQVVQAAIELMQETSRYDLAELGIPFPKPQPSGN